MSLQAVVELVDKMTGPLKTVTTGISEFTKGVMEGAKAELELQKAGDKATKSQTNLAASAKSVVSALAGLAVVKQIFDGFAASVIAADKLDDMAEKTGLAASKLQELDLLAKMSGTSLDTVAGAITRLTKSIGMSAEETSKQANAFELLGVKTKNADGSLKSSEQIFNDVAEAMRELKDTPEKAALGFAIFGQKFTEINPLISKSKEEIQSLREEAILFRDQTPEAFNATTASAGLFFDGIDKLRAIFTGLFTTIAGDVLPVINLFIGEMIKSYKEGGLFKNVLDGIKVVVVSLFIPAMKAAFLTLRAGADILNILGKGFGALGAIIAAVARGDFSAVGAIWDELKADVSNMGKAFNKFEADMGAASNANDVMNKALENTGNTATRVAPKMRGAATAVKEIKSELEGMVTQLKITNQAFGQDEGVKQYLEAYAKYQKDIKAGIAPERALALLTEANAQITLNRELRDGATAKEAFKKAGTSIQDYEKETALIEYENTLIGLSTEERGRLIEKFKEEQALRTSLIGLTAEQTQKIKDDTKAAQDRRDAAVETAKMTKLENEILSQSGEVLRKDGQSKIDFAKEMLASGKISVADYTKYVKDQLKKMTDDTKEEADAITLFWQEAAKNIQSSFAGFFFDIMQGKLDNLGDKFKSVIDRMIADALAANLADTLFGAGFSKSGKIGGLLEQGLGFLGGLFSGARASGGPVEAGKMYLVGEKGPEPFIPSVSGTIMPNSSMKTMGAGGGQVQINIKAMDSQDVRRALEKDNRWIADLINKSNRSYNLGM